MPELIRTVVIFSGAVLLSSGVDVFTVQRLAGHADAVTTARYDRRGEGERRRAAAHLRIPLLS